MSIIDGMPPAGSINGAVVMKWFVGFFLLLAPKSYADVQCSDPSLNLIAEVARIIQQNYIDEKVTHERLMLGAIEGMLAQVEGIQYQDQLVSNHLLLPTQFAQVRRALDGELVGIGVNVTFDPAVNSGVVTSIIPNSPGEQAGIKVGDRLLAINGQRLTGGFGLSRIPLSPGKMIGLLIQRDGQLFRLHVKQQRLKLPAVSSRIEGPIGYLRIIRFHQFVPPRIKYEIQRFDREKVRGMIVDLRDNPGGRMEDAITTAGFFLPPQTPIAVVQHRAKPQEIYRSKEPPIWLKPLVLLVNHGTSGGAEILAAAIQSQRRGVVIGEKTYGKASVQSIFPLSNQFALKLTTSRVLISNGHSFEGKGISPDLTIVPDPSKGDDPQYRSAIEILRYKIEQEEPTLIKNPAILKTAGQ